MRSVARWCYQHRFLVLAGWIVVLAAAFFGASSTGSNYAAGTQLSGTPSAQAAALLQRAAPSVAGDTETIVFQTKTGHVSDPAVRNQIQQMIGLGMAVAILIDALLIRTVLGPAAMHTFGKANWALPAFLDRRLPRLSLEGGEAPGQAAPEDSLDHAAAP